MEQGPVNIIVIGETGQGKSTFINSFFSYLEFETFEAAETDLKLLTKIKIEAPDGSFETFGDDDNEEEAVGSSATQKVKSYRFKSKKCHIRVVDTPGLADTRGVIQDEKNCEQIFDCFWELEKIHAFCFVLNSSVTKLTSQFQYCMKQLLTRLEKSSSDNITFLITNTRGTDYEAGDTLPCLKKFFKGTFPKIFVEREGEGETVFCVDSEGFKYLVAKQKHPSFEGDRNICKESWKHSKEECRRMVECIRDEIEPHVAKGTTEINTVRRQLNLISQPLSEIKEEIDNYSKNIAENKRKLETLSKNLREFKSSLMSLKRRDVRKKSLLPQVMVVCTSHETGCSELLRVDNKNKYHFIKKCHNPCDCNLEGIEKDKGNHPSITKCTSISTDEEKCSECRCHYSSHMWVDYDTEIFEETLPDPAIQIKIEDTCRQMQDIESRIAQQENKSKELKSEEDVMTEFVKSCADYLRHNALLPYDDSFEKYISMVISTTTSESYREELSKILKGYSEISTMFEKLKAGEGSTEEKPDYAKLMGLNYVNDETKNLIRERGQKFASVLMNELVVEPKETTTYILY